MNAITWGTKGRLSNDAGVWGMLGRISTSVSIPETITYFVNWVKVSLNIPTVQVAINLSLEVLSCIVNMPTTVVALNTNLEVIRVELDTPEFEVTIR